MSETHTKQTADRPRHTARGPVGRLLSRLGRLLELLGLTDGRCPCCSRLVHGTLLCAQCAARLAPRTTGFCPHCGMVFENAHQTPMRCGACRLSPRPWGRVYFYGVHEDLLRELIIQWKYGRSPARAGLLEQLAAQALVRKPLQAEERAGRTHRDESPDTAHSAAPAPLADASNAADPANVSNSGPLAEFATVSNAAASDNTANAAKTTNSANTVAPDNAATTGPGCGPLACAGHEDSRTIAPLCASPETPADCGETPQWDAVAPVPLHPRRLRWRGFNQSLELARAAARHTGAQLLPHALERTRETVPQTELSGSERKENIKGAFCADQGQIAGKRILLVDDVLTTGATLEECARTLKRAGAASVDVLVLARARGG